MIKGLKGSRLDYKKQWWLWCCLTTLCPKKNRKMWSRLRLKLCGVEENNVDRYRVKAHLFLQMNMKYGSLFF